MKSDEKDFPVTPGIRVLRSAKAEYEAFKYTYEEHGGTAQCAREMHVNEHRVIKTIVLKTSEKKPFVMLMHGDLEISLKKLARFLSVKSVETCTIDEAQKNSGYFVGGTSPFGFRKHVPIYAESSIFDLDWIIINGGARGFFVKIKPRILQSVLNATPVSAAQTAESD